MYLWPFLGVFPAFKAEIVVWELVSPIRDADYFIYILDSFVAEIAFV